MANDFNHLSASDALRASHAVTSIVSSTPNAYGLSTAEIAALNDGSVALATAINAQIVAQGAEMAATQAKRTTRKTLVASLGAVARTIYANPAVTDQMLKAISFAPRPTAGVRPQALPVPAELTAAAFYDGTVKLKWARNGNSSGAIFTVEASDDGLAWTMVDSTTRASLTLSGYAPGVAAWFRVTAKRAGLVSPASASASVYAPGAPSQVQLRVA